MPFGRWVSAVSEPTNILVVGVGGQGILFASRLLAGVSIAAGHDVKVAEVHGMAQRGGSVVTHVRIGRNVNSPLLEAGKADFIVAFEKLEALRWLSHSRKGAVMIVNDQEIAPLSVLTGAETYPAGIESELNARGRHVVSVDATSMASFAGSSRSANAVMLGVLARHLDIGVGKEGWLDAISAASPPGTAEVNRRAFMAGYEHEV